MSELGGIGSDGTAGVGSTERMQPATSNGIPATERRELAAEVNGVSNKAAAAVGERVAQNSGFDVLEWAGQTAKGYATGAINTVLDTATMVNQPINAGLRAVGVDYQFPTGLRVDPATTAEANAQRAVEIGTLVTGVAGLVKSAPALARMTDNAVNTARSALGLNAAKKIALGDLRAHEISAIQAAANLAKEDIYVTGSAARAMRRGLDTDLPLAQFGGSKAGTRSDIDYAVRASADEAVDLLNLPDVDPSFGVRGVNYINLDSGPAIRFSPGKDPVFLPQGGGRIWLEGGP